MWTGRQIAILWSVATLLLVVVWGLAHFTGILPTTGEAFVVLWLLASAAPAMATWQWASSGWRAGEDPARADIEGNDSREDVRDRD